MKTLVIVESPSKAKTIQGYLGNDFKVLSSYGHIADLAKGNHHGFGIDVKNNFKPSYILLESGIKTLELLMAEAELCDQILIGADPDREGEAIAWHLWSRLEDFGKPIQRIEIHEITKKGIEEALKKKRNINLPLFKAQEARRILDRLVGFTASPFLMNFFGSNLSAGRTQSVVTRMIIDREKEIENFKPEEYWPIQVTLKNSNESNFICKYNRRITNSNDAAKTKIILEGNNLDALYTVINVEAAEEKKKPSPPLITAKLQQLMAKEHSMSPEQTMKAAQSLYELGYITYMRTDSIRINDDAIKDARNFIKEKGFKIPKAANLFKNKDAAQDAHECIRPTDLSVTPDSPEFGGDDKLVYSAIWRYLLASQMTPAIYNTLKVSIALKSDPNQILKCSGKALKEKGFLEILGPISDSKIDIPNLIKGEELNLFGKNPVSAVQKFTQPPPRYSIAVLLDTLEEKKIGRPGTTAELVSKITTRNYVEQRGNVFYPTELGKKITNELTKFFSFMNYDYTADLEEKLDLIANSKLNQLDMLNDFYIPFKKELDKAYVANGSELCEICKGPLLKRISKAGDKFFSCAEWKNCRAVKQNKLS